MYKILVFLKKYRPTPPCVVQNTYHTLLRLLVSTSTYHTRIGIRISWGSSFFFGLLFLGRAIENLQSTIDNRIIRWKHGLACWEVYRTEPATQASGEGAGAGGESE